MTSELAEHRDPVRRRRLAAVLVLAVVLGVATSTVPGPGSPVSGEAAAGEAASDGAADGEARPDRGTTRPAPVAPRADIADLMRAGDHGVRRPEPRPAATPVTPEEPGTGTAVAAGGTFVAVGDSITAGVPAEGTVARPGPTSWLADPWLVPGRLVGGWARSGAITADMRAAVVPAPADLLVLLGGTNDLARGIPWQETAVNLRGIAGTVGARTVLLSATPPSTATPAARTAFNARLAQLATEQGWHYVDPWSTVSAGGAFTPGSSADGIHPTPAVARIAGQAIGWEMAALYP